MKATKKQSSKQRQGKNNWGGPRKESKLIKKHADKWCRDNGYPINERKRTKYGRNVANSKYCLILATKFHRAFRLEPA
jgi:hypothetical protein